MNEIEWTKKKQWGTIGFSHFVKVAIGGIEYDFTIDQPSKGQWVARGWSDGKFFFYRDSAYARTLAGMKDQVVRQIGELKLAAKGDARSDLERWDSFDRDHPSGSLSGGYPRCNECGDRMQLDGVHGYECSTGLTADDVLDHQYSDRCEDDCCNH